MFILVWNQGLVTIFADKKAVDNSVTDLVPGLGIWWVMGLKTDLINNPLDNQSHLALITGAMLCVLVAL